MLKACYCEMFNLFGLVSIISTYILHYKYVFTKISSYISVYNKWFD